MTNTIPYGIIYKISSPDDTLHYYGLTTTSLENRFKNHLESYYLYKKDHTSNYCSSFIIFDKYPIDLIQYTIIESHQNITKQKLNKRERYFIENNSCVNIFYKQPLSTTSFYDIHNNIKPDISENNTITVHNYDSHILPLLNLFGYQLISQTQYTFKHADVSPVILFNIQKKIKPIIQNYIDLSIIPIIPKKFNLIQNIQNILQIYHLQLLFKSLYIKSTKSKKYCLTYKLLIENITSHIQPQQHPIHQTHEPNLQDHTFQILNIRYNTPTISLS
jgi:hypothetical protein